MKRKRKNKSIQQNTFSKSRVKAHTKSRNRVDPRAKVDGIPPTDSLQKLPDEAYGDTEIPDHARS